MFKSIKDYMEIMSSDKRVHYILLWDEAPYLSNDILKDLKLLMNFSMDSKDCFSLVLLDQPILNNILEKQIHEALKQMIIINYELKIESRNGFNVVIVKTNSGNFACIPDYDAGCHLSTLNDLFWNSERLREIMNKVDAITVAHALQSVAEHIELN